MRTGSRGSIDTVWCVGLWASPPFDYQAMPTYVFIKKVIGICRHYLTVDSHPPWDDAVLLSFRSAVCLEKNTRDYDR